MATYTMNYKIPRGNFQSSGQNETYIPHSTTITEQTSSAPFFLQRPSISSELASRLIPIDVDLHTKKNMEEHSTNHYDIPGLVLRRGQPFSFTVTFNKDFNPEQYQLYVRLAIGSQSMISKKTQIRLLVDGTASGNGWSAKQISPSNEEDKKKKNQISLQINSPSDAIIGKYTLLLEVRPISKDDKEDVQTKQDLSLFLIEIDLYFLFNPWNKDDACSLSSSDQISEYVMNEHGQIYLGTADKPQSIPWYYGQFERSVLLTALSLLDKAQLPPQNRTDPSVLLRIISSKICSNPGTNSGIFPSSFDTRIASSQNNSYTSSTAILKQYILSNGRSIQGGCGNNWQHAAVFCSLSRALGIPCRIVTVYNASCRSDGTENNDVHWDIKQRPLKQLNTDVICSSHVWNECWMHRSDLSNNEQDWQIIDSTPVQMCDGIRRTGPCSVSSLKNGQLGFRWDSPFIHSTINGNKYHWIVYPDGNMELLDVEENQIGTKIITRSLKNEFEPEDLTKSYKNLSNEKEKSAKQSKNDVNIQLKTPDNAKFGDNITLELNVKNNSNDTRTITTALTVCVTSSISQRLIFCSDQPIQTLKLEAKKDENIQLNIPSELYINYGKQENINIKYYINSQVKETNQTFTRDDNIIFDKNDIIKPILDEDVIEIGQPILLKIQLANTLSRPLNHGKISVDGLGVNQIIHINRSFAPKESTIIQTKLFPKRIGVSRLYVTFISDDVCSLTQTIPLEIIFEPIKKVAEPLIKTETTNVTSTVEQKTETKQEEKKPDESPQPNSNNQEKSEQQEKPSPKTEPETPEKKPPNIPEIKTDSPPSITHEHEDEDDVEDLYLKKQDKYLQPNTANNSSLPHGSTLSLDKDKMSIDSLDISNDRRQTSNNNTP